MRDAAERLRLREAREEAAAKALSDRIFRQQVQASELKLQTHLDRVRWNLVLDVERMLADRMRNFMAEEAAYFAWLERLIIEAVALIEADVVVVANAADQRQLARRWSQLAAQLPDDKTVTLAPAEAVRDTLGGVLLHSVDQRIRIDQTFEGRLERLRPRIQQTILERLLPGGFETSSLFTG